MTRRLSAILLGVLCLFLTTACRPEVPDLTSGQYLDIYYRVNASDANEVDGVRALSLPVDDADNLMQRAVDLLLAPPQDERLLSPFPSDTRRLDTSLEDGRLTVNLSAPYGTMTGVSLTMANACATLTLCELEGVRELVLLAEGTPYAVRPVLTPSDFLTEDLIGTSMDRTLMLYFVNPETGDIQAEYRTILMREYEPVHRYVMEELLNGPKTAGLSPLTTTGESLLGISLQNGICYVNMPSAFYENIAPETYAQTLDAICFALTELPNIQAVQFNADGQTANLPDGIDSLRKR